MNQLTFKHSRNFNVSPEHVFDALLDPNQAKNFMFASTSGLKVSTKIDARVGGSFIFEDKTNGGGIHTGKFLEIYRPRRIVVTLIFKKISDDITHLTIDITPEYGGNSKLTFIHEVPANWAEYKPLLDEGWEDVLDRMKKTIT